MNRRLVLAGVVVALLTITAGCSALPFFGDDSFSKERLDEEPPGGDYAWNETDAKVTIWVLDGQFKAIYDLNGTEQLELFRRDFRSKYPLGIRAVQFRYPNGTVINGSQLSIRKKNNNAVVTLPDANGSVALTADAENKHFRLPNYLAGSYEVVLPENMRIGIPIVGDVSPGGATVSQDDQGRVHIHWDDASANIAIRYYLQRDIYIFGGVLLLIFLLGGGGALYRYWQIQSLREVREEVGLDVDTEDDEFDRGPPPGMQ